MDAVQPPAFKKLKVLELTVNDDGAIELDMSDDE